VTKLHIAGSDIDAFDGPRPRHVDHHPARPVPDQKRAEEAARDLLVALGVDIDDPHVAQTPRRVAAALIEFLTATEFEATTFPNVDRYDEMVLVRSIRFTSLCAHHLLPFVGVAHVAYLPGERIIGLSKLARAVRSMASGLQLQERLTTQIGQWLDDTLAPRGSGVVMAAEHMCMSLRGVRAHEAVTVTSRLTGLVRTDPRTREEFLALTRSA
jgi:GTP cyclohydrolase I